MEKQIKIALAGNPNCGKTTLFNALTGSNQFVGNWPGVTVEKKEGRLKKHDDVVIMDLPGIYSLSPYTLEEVVARNYLIDERPDAILNIVDGTNLERNLYLTTQLTELGIPVVMAVNMMDIVRKSGDQININQLSQQLGCKVVEISALKGDGVMAAAEAAIEAARSTKTVPMHTFSGPVEHAIAHIEEAAVHTLPEEQQRWYAIKIFERDDKVLAKLHIPEDVHAHIEADIKAAEEELDDDAESIITNERYVYIAEVIRACYRKKSKATQSASDKIDRIVTNRWLGLPIFAVVMFLVYWVAMVAVGAPATDWANDGVFGDGWHLLGIGSGAYNDANDEYTAATEAVDAFLGLDTEAEDFDADAALADMKDFVPSSDTATVTVEDEETLAENELTAYYDAIPDGADKETTVAMTYLDAVKYFEQNGFDAPDPADYGVWVPGIPVLIGNGLEKAGCADWLSGLILDGIVAGVGAVLGFVPQMLVLFLMLAFLEACGYMSRIAFVLDRIFRKFGLSGKSFIPMLIGVGCGVPGVMASRTIENERDRRMTIMTTTFIPCGAKVPFIGMIAGALFGGSAWVSPPRTSSAWPPSSSPASCSRRPRCSPAIRLRLSWSCRPTTGRRSATSCAPCGSAAGPSSRRPVRSSCCPRSSFGSPPTSARSTARSACCPRTRSTTPSLLPSAACSPGSSSPSAGATGRRQSPPSPALSPRRTLSARSASSTAAATAACTRTSRLPSTASAVTASWCSTFCALRALRPSAPSSAR